MNRMWYVGCVPYSDQHWLLLDRRYGDVSSLFSDSKTRLRDVSQSLQRFLIHSTLTLRVGSNWRTSTPVSICKHAQHTFVIRLTKKFRYTHSLKALSHALLLAPQNPFHTIHFAETAYTANDIPLAIRYFLRTVELIDSDHGIALRAWYGVKLVRCSHPQLAPLYWLYLVYSILIQESYSSIWI